MVKAKVWAATAGAVVGQLLAAAAAAGFDFSSQAEHWMHGAAGALAAFTAGYIKKETVPDSPPLH